MAGGRPSEYRPEFCDVVISTMSAGYSKMAAAGEIGCCLNTLKSWMAEHPEFLTAVKLGEALRVKTLEEGLLGAEIGPRVTARIFALKNAAPDEWRDRQEVDASMTINIARADADL